MRHHVALAAALALLAGCGSGGGAPAARAAGALDADVFAGVAPTVDGDELDLASLADRDLVVWFWAPW
jgi:hypothetical protein